MKTKLTLRLDQHVIEDAKAYAAHHGTSLSKLVEHYFQVISNRPKSDEISPFVASLRGILPSEIAEDEYRAHLEDKYK